MQPFRFLIQVKINGVCPFASPWTSWKCTQNLSVNNYKKNISEYQHYSLSLGLLVCSMKRLKFFIYGENING